jgi:hypothetical protein
MAATVNWSEVDTERLKQLKAERKAELDWCVENCERGCTSKRLDRLDTMIRDLQEKYEQLPYDFDLCYDIKNKAQLRHEINTLRHKLSDLELMIGTHQILMEDL